MKFSTRLIWMGCAVAGLASNVFAGVSPSSCSTGPTPSATLLVPFFEVDFTSVDRQTTLVAVTNTAASPTLAHVVLWTDWGVPTLAFDIFLAANDVQTLNVRDIFAGVLPTTGGGAFAGCTNPLTMPAHDATALLALRKQHTGQADLSGNCAGSGAQGGNVATGYMTIDAAQACSTEIFYPTHSGYFLPGGTGIASNANVLVGDFFYVDTFQAYAQGNEAVHIAADAARFGGQPATFYGAWNGHSGDDARAPLGTKYRARYLVGGAFSGGTDFVVWAEPSTPTPTAVTCGARPSFVDPCQYLRVKSFNENAQGIAPVNTFIVEKVAAKLAVGTPPLSINSSFGFIDFENRVQPSCALEGGVPDFPLQSWVMPLHKALGEFSVGYNAYRLADDLCPSPAL